MSISVLLEIVGISVVLGLTTALAMWILFKRLQRKIEPRVLVSRESIPLGDRQMGSPIGLRIIDGVRVRRGDIVILANQDIPSSNGVWIASANSWHRYNRLGTTDAIGSWRVPTAGSQAGTLWTRDLNSSSWIRVDSGSGRRILPLESEDFAPNCPAEAAAYLLRLGVNPNLIGYSRGTCIEGLVQAGFLTRAQGDLFLAKPENLTTEVNDHSGLLVRLPEQSWAVQVVTHMTSIQDSYQRLMTSSGYEALIDAFIQREVTGFKLIKEKNKNLPTPPPRRSRYGRPPVI